MAPGRPRRHSMESQYTMDSFESDSDATTNGGSDSDDGVVALTGKNIVDDGSFYALPPSPVSGREAWETPHRQRWLYDAVSQVLYAADPYVTLPATCVQPLVQRESQTTGRSSPAGPTVSTVHSPDSSSSLYPTTLLSPGAQELMNTASLTRGGPPKKVWVMSRTAETAAADDAMHVSPARGSPEKLPVVASFTPLQHTRRAHKEVRCLNFEALR